MSKRKIGLLLGLVLGITVLHSATTTTRAPLHIFYRELYFIPIIVAGLWYGKKGGLAVSLAVSLIYLPHVLKLAETSMQVVHHMQAVYLETMWGNLFQIVIFNLAGFFTGSYGDIKKGYLSRIRVEPVQPAKFSNSFLLYVDDKPISQYAVQYFAGLFGQLPDVKTTLLWISPEKDREYFSTEEEARNYNELIQEQGTVQLEKAKQTLVDGGIAEDHIQLKTVAVNKKSRISDKLIEEVSNGDYNAVVIGKPNLTKSQEFLFGSAAVRLVREAGINVIAVKMPESDD